MPWICAGDGSGKEHCVWRSLVLHDGTMVTGDSGGNVQFWDAQLGTRTAAFQACSQLALPQGHHTRQSQPAYPASATRVLSADQRSWLPERKS